MEKMTLFLIILFCFVVLHNSFNINMTSVGFIFDQQANLLIGQPTSNFPKEAFINSLLYGHSDVNFSYNDFLTTYGTKIDKPHEGSLIIGNDLQLGGIVLPSLSNVALPIPGSYITSVPFTQLSKYFPKGYTMLSSKEALYMYGSGRENSKYGESIVCDNCYAGFGFADDEDINPFQLNNFFEKWNLANITRLYFYLYGYIKEWDPKQYSGKVIIYFYRVNGEGADSYYLINDQYDNFILFSSANHRNFSFEGSLYAEIPNYPNFYNFTGWWQCPF